MSETASRRGRPEVGPVITLRLPEELLAAADELAAAQGIKRAELLRRYIEVGVRRDQRKAG